MVIQFYKYHGAGNDFIIIDDRRMQFDADNSKLIEAMCARHFGIGADGLMLLRSHVDYDFEMLYFNADGQISSMCGNGGRCIVAFANYLGIIKNECHFLAVDGKHQAKVIDDVTISLEMINVQEIEDISESACLLDTGSPHYVERRENIANIDLLKEAKAIRYNDRFKDNGVNVNFIEMIDDVLHIRTYERGVENETLACGTGLTAAAIAMNYWGQASNQVHVKAIGGALVVDFQKTGNVYAQVWKTGPTKKVFEGVWP